MNWYERQGHFGLVTPLIFVNGVLVLHEWMGQYYNTISAKPNVKILRKPNIKSVIIRISSCGGGGVNLDHHW
jgi:hypothetical protein